MRPTQRSKSSEIWLLRVQYRFICGRVRYIDSFVHVLSFLGDDFEVLHYPELDVLQKRKTASDELAASSQSDSSSTLKSVIPFVCEPPLHPWSRLLPSQELQLKQLHSVNMSRLQSKAQPKRKSLRTFAKPTNVRKRTSTDCLEFTLSEQSG